MQKTVLNPLVSIIIPIYNRAHLISETLDSILVQTYVNWECIIIDDDSTDNTIDVLAEYTEIDNRFQYYKRPIDRIKGPNACRNYGFELSKGEYIKWFDSDDVMLPNLLEKQILSFDKNVDVSVCKLIYYEFNSGISIKENTIFSKYLIEDYFTGKIAFYISGPLWKRSFLEKQTDLFDLSITNLDDWDFNLRMLYQEPKVVYLEEALIQYRKHETSLSHEINKLNFNEIQSEFRAREKNLKLLKTNKLANARILQNYSKDRYKFILREALVSNDNKRFYYLRMLFILQLKTLDFKGFIKTIFSFTIFSVFNKGYKLLK
ncbi:glycosyl transferase family 2 [Flavobacterium sp. 103]|uniref:glycosyltransferase family 2 protein n=1 Tax=Flavobacterium sp. 103 TaxID=2135624 RepID=UPI000D5FBEEB|nr:glycosyltransferase [Flavobacterium sp. 103]PVX46619.1 glycosyl transferase family 2 [Flavobacterium sp. 103]